MTDEVRIPGEDERVDDPALAAKQAEARREGGLAPGEVEPEGDSDAEAQEDEEGEATEEGGEAG